MMTRSLFLLPFVGALFCSCRTTGPSATEAVIAPVVYPAVFQRLPHTDSCSSANPLQNPPQCVDPQQSVYFGRLLAKDTYALVIGNAFQLQPIYSPQYANALAVDTNNNKYVTLTSDPALQQISNTTPTSLSVRGSYDVVVTLNEPATGIHVGRATLHYSFQKNNLLDNTLPANAASQALAWGGTPAGANNITLDGMELADFCTGGFVNNCDIVPVAVTGSAVSLVLKVPYTALSVISQGTPSVSPALAFTVGHDLAAAVSHSNAQASSCGALSFNAQSQPTNNYWSCSQSGNDVLLAAGQSAGSHYDPSTTVVAIYGSDWLYAFDVRNNPVYAGAFAAPVP